MNTKERVRNDILVGMRMHLDACTMQILDAIIIKTMQNVEMTETTTLPATLDDTNQYIMQLFDTKKAPRLSPKTVEFYKSTINEFMTLVSKPLNKITESDVEYYLQTKRSGNTNASLNNLRRNLSAFFTWMRKEKIIGENPCDGIEPYTMVEKPIDHMEATDMEKLKKGCVYRKTTATNICRRGGSEDAAGEYLGHAPRNVTGKHYTYKGDRYVEQIFHSYVEAV